MMIAFGWVVRAGPKTREYTDLLQEFPTRDRDAARSQELPVELIPNLFDPI